MAPRTPRTPGREWPPKYYPASSSSPHMEALGIIAAIYNELEYTLFLVSLVYSQLENDVSKSLFENMSNQQRLRFLRDCSESRTKNNPMREHVINFIKCFEIAAENRNTLMHSKINSSINENDEYDTNILMFSKSSRAAPTIDKTVLLDVDVLRRTAFDLQDVDVYGRQIWLWCNARAPWSKHYHGRKKISGLAPPSATFLKKLALPSRLVLM